MSGTEEDLAADILRGADELAQFLFGNRDQRRKVYHLIMGRHLLCWLEFLLRT